MSLRRSIVITASAKYFEIGLGFLSSIILARLLTPEDFGIYSIAASIALIGYMFRNFGVSQFIIQAEKLTDEILQTSFSLTLILSWSIAAALALASGPLGSYYGTEGLTTVFLLLSINFVLLPFGAISGAVLRRNLAFDKLAVINLSAAVVGPVVGVTSAWLDAGYLALVWASNASTLTTVLLTLVFRPKGLPWRPGLKQVRKIFSFGLKVGLLDFVNQTGDSVSKLIIGKSHGLHDVGIYSRAYGLFMLFEYVFIEGIRQVVLPYLSKAKRERALLGPAYLKILNFVSIFMVPSFVFLFFNASSIVHVLYGDQWTEAVALVQVMCFAGLLLTPTIFFDQLLIAQGYPGQALAYQTAFQVVRLGTLLALISGSLVLTAYAVVAGAAIKALLVILLARSHFQLKLPDLGKAVLPALLSMLAVGLGSWLATSALLQLDNLALQLAVSILLSGAAWLSVVMLAKHPVVDEFKRALGRA